MATLRTPVPINTMEKGSEAAFVVLLRAVNVGGTGKLPMADLRRLCEAAGFGAVQTLVSSGNVVLRSEQPEAAVKAVLASALRAQTGKPVGVLVRTADEMRAVLANNPFPDAAPERTVAIFLDDPPAPDTLTRVVGQTKEEVRLGAREIYVLYSDTMGRSKLRILAARDGTARNMNTVAKLAKMAAEPAQAG